MAEQILPKGLRFFNKHESAPDFVVGNLVVTMNDLFTFCKENEALLTEYDGKKQLKIQILKSKDGKLYGAVDTYKKEAATTTAPAQQQVAKTKAIIEEPGDQLPF